MVNIALTFGHEKVACSHQRSRTASISSLASPRNDDADGSGAADGRHEISHAQLFLGVPRLLRLFILSWTSEHVRLEQPVQVRDDKAHFGVVDRFLRGTAPRFFSALVVGENTDDLDRRMIEIEGAGVFDATAENEM